MKKYKYWIIGYILSIVFIIFFLIILINLYDSLHINGIKYLNKEKESHLHLEMRRQAKGIIDNIPFDSIIIGSSTLQNTSSKEAKKVLGGEFINISIGGGDFYERNKILHYTFQRKKHIKKIIYSIDYFTALTAKKGNKLFKEQNIEYLYDNNPFNDILVYNNSKFLNCLLTFSQSTQCIGVKTTLDRPNNWVNDPRQLAKYGGINNWLKLKENPDIKSSLKRILKAYIKIQNEDIKIQKLGTAKTKHTIEYIDNNIIELVKKNPNTDFILVLPPYARFVYATWIQTKTRDFELYTTILKYLVNQSYKYPNMKLYGFEHKEFLNDIANYMDSIHYHHSINSKMLSFIKNKDMELTNDNINDYINIIISQALNYDLCKLGGIVKSEL